MEQEELELQLGHLAMNAALLEKLVATYCYSLMQLDQLEGARLVNRMDALLQHINAFASARLLDPGNLLEVKAAVTAAREAWAQRSRLLHSYWGVHSETGDWMRASLKPADFAPIPFAAADLRAAISACGEASGAFARLLIPLISDDVAPEVAWKVRQVDSPGRNP